MPSPRFPLCPCHSGQCYITCCKPFHLGKIAENPIELMRSRYSAFALCLPEYIIETTHPAHPGYSDDIPNWIKGITSFSKTASFENLFIYHTQQKGNIGSVTFGAKIQQGIKDQSFTEKSLFEKVHDRWLYLAGSVTAGIKPNFFKDHELFVLPLAYYGHPILSKKTTPIHTINQDTHRFLHFMKETMLALDGIGLAAPQVGKGISVFIMRQIENGNVLNKIREFINPKIIEVSERTVWDIEECLSIPKISAKIERPKEVLLEYTTAEGEVKKEHFGNLYARIILHEMDHLEGILFLNYLDEEVKKRAKSLTNSLL
jgi:peptide deformylase